MDEEMLREDPVGVDAIHRAIHRVTLSRTDRVARLMLSGGHTEAAPGRHGLVEAYIQNARWMRTKLVS